MINLGSKMPVRPYKSRSCCVEDADTSKLPFLDSSCRAGTKLSRKTRFLLTMMSVSIVLTDATVRIKPLEIKFLLATKTKINPNTHFYFEGVLSPQEMSSNVSKSLSRRLQSFNQQSN